MRALLADTNCGQITLVGDATVHLGSQLSPSRSVKVGGGTHQVTISGDSNVDGAGDTRLFCVPDGVTVRLNRFSLVGGHATKGGGGTHSQDDLTVSNCVFSAIPKVVCRGEQEVSKSYPRLA